MKHGLLYGSFEISIDEKNRMLIPAEVRESIVPDRDGNGFFVIVGQNRKLWLYPDKYYEALVTQEPPELLPGDAALEFDHLNFSAAHRLELDKQNRVLLPDKLLKRTGTQRAVAVIGARDHLELWDRAEWEARLQDLDRRRKEIADQKRNSSGPTSTG